MLRLLIRGLFVVFVFSFALFGIENFEMLCDEEVAKKEVNLLLIKKYCSKAGDAALKSHNYNNASWYYLLSGELKKNIEVIENKNNLNSLIIFTNVAHSYILSNNFKNAEKAYENANLYDIQEELYEAIKEDYKLLFKLYPNKKIILEKGFKIWENVYSNFLEEEKKLIEMMKEYHKALKYEEDTNYLKAPALFPNIFE